MKYQQILQENCKFACISFTRIQRDLKLSEPIDLGDGRWVLFEPPVDVDKQWKEWLGSIQSDNIAKCKLWLWAESPSTNPDILDSENEKLAHKVENLLGSLLLIGSLNESAYALTGANNRGLVEVR